ncbi:MAG: hypothetical protein C5B55_10395 [Blastocatellia bacterium]|nr:MAG: hypothetical protein C5B55_10395 [Blastocatellia bacterium]
MFRTIQVKRIRRTISRGTILLLMLLIGTVQFWKTSADKLVNGIEPLAFTSSIQGTITTSVGNVLPNVRMNLTGTQSSSALSLANGSYTFQSLPVGGSYTVTPANYNYAFNPANRSYPNLTSSQIGADFTAVTLLNDNLANAINLTGSLGTVYYGANYGGTKECTEAPHAGNPATASVWYRWTAPVSGTIFVSTQGSSIDTVLDVYQGSSLNVCSLPTAIASNDDIGGFDTTSRLSFVATANSVYYIAVDSKFGTGPFNLTIDTGVTISGKAQNVNGRGLQGITIGIDGDRVAQVTTNASGAYSFTVPRGGTYTITPSDVSVALWTPDQATFNNLQNDAPNTNFTATTPTPSITGELKNLTQGTSGITVTVGGSGITSKPCSIATNAGVTTYTCSNLNIRGDYQVTPSSTTYVFTPTLQVFNDLQGDIFQGAGSDFTGSAAPLVTTVAASSITSATATLNGTVNPRGVSTNAQFIWSTSPTFITFNTTPLQSVGSGTIAVSYSANLTGLSPGTTYYFYASATNGAVSATGTTLNFTTIPQTTIQTNPAGLKVSIDNGPLVTAPQVQPWTPGSQHTIATTSPQAGAVGTQYVFANWSDSGAISHMVTAPSSNTTYTANFTTQYMLTMNAGSNGSVGPASGFFNSGQSVQITGTPNGGFVFGSWTGTGTGSFTGSTNPATVTMNGPITETASFTQNNVQLTIQTNPAGRTISIDGGAALVAPQTIMRQAGSSVTIATTSPQAGAAGTQYVFANWSDSGGISHSVTVPATATTYTANFTTQYQLTMSAGAGGTVAPATGFFNSGQSVQIMATPNAGFTFNGWGGTGTGSVTGATNPATVTMNGPITETASFTQNPATIALSSATYSVNEGAGNLTVTVIRSGNTTGVSSVDYKTSDTDTFTVGCSDTVNNQGAAYGRCDYATSLDTLTFGLGETMKQFQIPIINDSIHETDETFTVSLSNASGATLGSPSSATITIVDDDTGNTPNPIFTTSFFVRQHYLDFLSREPEPGEPWSAVLNGCSDVNNNPACDRITVSGDFFGSPEFQLKGYFVYRFYKLAFNRLPTYLEIVTDMRAVTGQTANEVFQKKAAYTNAFVQRTEFINTYGSMTNGQYVTALMGRYGLTQITTPDPAAPDGTNKVTLTIADLTNQLGAGPLTPAQAGTLTRAQVLRAIADSDQVFNAEFNQAFVAMQYYGYLRRVPDTAGFNAWLTYLNAHPTDSRTMINGFMNSNEYRLRFGPLP